MRSKRTMRMVHGADEVTHAASTIQYSNDAYLLYTQGR